MNLKDSHPVLGEYLYYTANTESPALFHAWAFLSGVSAALGRRCFYQFGTFITLPNMFVILCGPTSLRKSSAMDPISELLMENTGIRFAPSDTGGQRQGLIEAMLGEDESEEDEDDKRINKLLEAGNLNDFLGGDFTHTINTMSLDARDPNSMYIQAPNLSSVIGENNSALLTFLEQLYDGKDYTYRLKTSVRVLKDSIIGMLAGTTAAAFAQSIPALITGQGFMARCVFVYADEQKLKKIARPSLRTDMKPRFAKLFSQLFNEFSGRIDESPEAAKIFDEIYLKGTHILDLRFVQYGQRRQAHLQKVAMALAASRLSHTIEAVDVKAADALLSFTEDGMPFALGEYGMAKLSAAKARLVEQLCSTRDPIPMTTIFALMSKDMNQTECKHVIEELQASNRISVIDVPQLGTCVLGISSSDLARKRRYEKNMLAEAISDHMDQKKKSSNGSASVRA